MTRVTGILLGIVGVLAGVLAGVLGTLGVQLLSEGGDDEAVYLEDISGFERAHDGARMYCTLGGVVPGATSLHDPKYLQCVEDRTRHELIVDGHPEAETAESRLY